MRPRLRAWRSQRMRAHRETKHVRALAELVVFTTGFTPCGGSIAGALNLDLLACDEPRIVGHPRAPLKQGTRARRG